MSDLRTRIRDLLLDWDLSDTDRSEIADAVIRELPELTYGNGHLHCGTHDDDDRCPCPCCGNRPTEWKADA